MTKQTQSFRTDRFLRIAPRRTDRVLEALRLLGNCSNKSAYDYSDEQVARIFRAIDAELRETKSKFSRTAKKRFSL